MLTNSLRRQIEWHFQNYEADAKLYAEKENDICESGITVNWSGVGSQNGNVSRSTENKAFKLIELHGRQNWASVVRNTFAAFRFEPEYEIMVALYIKRTRKCKLFCDGLWETTFYRWRDKWLEHAYKWAKLWKLL